MDSSIEESVVIGQRVGVSGKGSGTVGFTGKTSFASGHWVGVILDEPKGKNNGTFQGVTYFEAPENQGLFVRQSQLIVIDEDAGRSSGKKAPATGSATKTTPPKPSPDEKATKQGRSRIPGFGFLSNLATSKTFSQLSMTSSKITVVKSPSTPSLVSASASTTDLSEENCIVSPSPKSSSLAKTKTRISLFSKASKQGLSPLRRSASYVPGGVIHDSEVDVNVILSQVPRSVTFSGFNPSKTPVASPSTAATKAKASTTRQVTPSKSSPQLTGSNTTAIHFPSFGNLSGNKSHSPSLHSLGSGLGPTTVACHRSGKARSATSCGDITEESTQFAYTPPKKPPRPSLGRRNGSSSETPFVDTTPNPPPPSPFKTAEDSSTFEGDNATTKNSATISGIYRRRKHCCDPRHSNPLTLGVGSGGYRIYRKYNSPTINVDSGVASGCPMSNPSLTETPNQSSLIGAGIMYIPRLVQPGSFVKRLPISGAVKDATKQSPPSKSEVQAGKESGGSKRQSFVETLAEPIVPQYTQGPLYTPTMTPNSGGPAGEDRFGAMQLVESLRHEAKDLQEKLDVLKAKRAADQEKLRETDRIKLQLETLTEFKSKVLESQASLKTELKKAKQDARDAITAKEQHAEEMSDLSEAVEMATLDKEMAEEKVETLQLELEQGNEKIAQLTTELAALQEELGGNLEPEQQAANSVQMKQLQGENTRMREALLKLRDSLANEKHQGQKLHKESEVLKTEVAELTKNKERLETRCDELEMQVSELQEMNDAALGAEEMVVNLTEKNLDLEEQVSVLREEVADLEALQDVNNQLQESAKETEMEIRDDLYRALAANTNIVREKEAILETLGDREMTIGRFRELVQKLRDENDILRKNLADESSKSIPGFLPEALDFKKIFAETKAQTTAIDLELRRIEAKEAALHASYLNNFMPDGFMKQGGDNDALLMLLLIPRMISKVELLLSQARDKLTPLSFADGVQHNDDIASSADAEKYAFSCQFSYLLYALLSELHRWSSALNTCSTSDFLKVGSLHADLSVKEKGVDFYLELLRKSQLDENIPLDGLEKCITSFQSFYSVHLGDEQTVHSTLVSDLCLASAAACDCLIVDVARLLHIIKKTERESDIGALLQDVKAIGESLRQLAKRTRRYLPDPPKQPPLSNKLQSQLLNDSIALTRVVKVFQDASKQVLLLHAAMSAGADGDCIAGPKVEEYFQAALEKCERRVEGSAGYKEVLKEWLSTALMTMTDLAQVVNEAAMMPKEKPPTPLSLRAEAVKAELDQSRNLRVQLEAKEETISELRKILRTKQEEFSEATIRKELAEKKLSNASKDSEMTIEKLTRKLEDTLLNQQRKEREFQATMEHFQAEIDSIETEKGELKEKLMSTTKRRLLDGISGQSGANSPISSPAHGVPHQVLVPVSSSIQNSDVIPTSGLLEYTRFLQRENWRMKSQKVLDIFKRLKPIDLPNKQEADAVRQLEKEYWKLKHESNTLLCESIKVVLNKELNSHRKQYLLLTINAKKSELSTKMTYLKTRIENLIATRKGKGIIKADFASFSPELSKQEVDAEAVKVGMIKFPGWENSKEKPKRIVLSREQLQHIHNLLVPI